MLTEGSYEARIAGVVRRHLEKRFGDWVSFEAIMVVLRTDQWGKDSVHVYVVYDGNGESLITATRVPDMGTRVADAVVTSVTGAVQPLWI